MDKHQGFNTSAEKGAQCSNCEEWIPVGENAVIMEPVEVQDTGSVRGTALCIHGVICEECYESLK